MRTRALPVAVIAAVCALSSACGSAARRIPAAPAGTPPAARAQLSGPARIAVIVMENHEYAQVVGSRGAPFINRLARTGAVATSMYAIGHPSLPNYLALVGGSTFGIDSDCTDCRVAARTSLPTQLSDGGIAWRAYMEGLSHACFTGSDAGRYAKRHDPFVYFTAIARDPALCANVVPLSRLSRDEQSGSAPRFLWISPDLCHDMHDCSISTGDRFLSRLVPPLLRALGPRGLLVLTFDEGTSDDGCCRFAAGGHIVTILAGPGARRGARLATPVDHYSVLQLVEDLLGLARLRGAACSCTRSLAPLLAR